MRQEGQLNDSVTKTLQDLQDPCRAPVGPLQTCLRCEARRRGDSAAGSKGCFKPEASDLVDEVFKLQGLNEVCVPESDCSGQQKLRNHSRGHVA